MLDLSAIPLGLIGLIFCLAALLVWWGGRQLPEVAAAIGRRSGIGDAFAGMLLLGGITTLPELATTSSAAAFGAEALGLSNALGSIAFNLILLALADAVLGRAALTSMIAAPATLLQGVLGMLLLAGVAAIIAAGDTAIGPVGAGTAVLLAGCLFSLRIAAHYAARPGWRVVDPLPDVAPDEPSMLQHSRARLAARLAGLAAIVLAGGLLLSQTGEAIAVRTPLGEGLVGMVLLAIATSLPELTAITAAVRGRYYEMAVGDIFGANLFNVAMIFLIDLVSPGPPVLGEAGAFHIFAALIGLMLTGIFVVGLLERADRTFLRMGWDSVAALVLYAGGLGVLTGLG